jgi:hypothetical protein
MKSSTLTKAALNRIGCELAKAPSLPRRLSIRQLFHRFVHRLGWNRRTMTISADKKKRIRRTYRCMTCGQFESRFN